MYNVYDFIYVFITLLLQAGYKDCRRDEAEKESGEYSSVAMEKAKRLGGGCGSGSCYRRRRFDEGVGDALRSGGSWRRRRRHFAAARTTRSSTSRKRRRRNGRGQSQVLQTQSDSSGGAGSGGGGGRSASFAHYFVVTGRPFHVGQHLSLSLCQPRRRTSRSIVIDDSFRRKRRRSYGFCRRRRNCRSRRRRRRNDCRRLSMIVGADDVGYRVLTVASTRCAAFQRSSRCRRRLDDRLCLPRGRNGRSGSRFQNAL